MFNISAWRRVLVAVAIGSGHLGAQTGRSPQAIDVVAKLYRDFAWEAVVEAPAWHGHELLDQPRAVLAKYFDDRLVRLWLADRACEARTHKTCNIDFLPIWDSQDPSGTFVTVTPTNDSTRVQVELRHPAKPAPRQLQYRLVKTTSGWRIDDISLPGKWSLVALLSKKP